jgi:hypothetical protein
MFQLSAERSASYDALLTIREAQRAFRERDGDTAVDALLSIVSAAGAESVVGVRLLQKHKDISACEIMLEVDAVDDEGFALVTSAVAYDGVQPVVNNSWRMTQRDFTPVEFSACGSVPSRK